jgi:hypothetical protein
MFQPFLGRLAKATDRLRLGVSGLTVSPICCPSWGRPRRSRWPTMPVRTSSSLRPTSLARVRSVEAGSITCSLAGLRSEIVVGVVAYLDQPLPGAVVPRSYRRSPRPEADGFADRGRYPVMLSWLNWRGISLFDRDPQLSGRKGGVRPLLRRLGPADRNVADLAIEVGRDRHDSSLCRRPSRALAESRRVMALIGKSSCTGFALFPPPVSGYKFKPYRRIWP